MKDCTYSVWTDGIVYQLNGQTDETFNILLENGYKIISESGDELILE